MSKRQKRVSAAFLLPHDILCLFAQAGGYQLAVSMALTCQAMKRLVDEICEFPTMLRLDAFLDPLRGNRRRRALVGKFTQAELVTSSQLQYVPHYVHTLYLNGDFTDVKPSDVRFPGRLRELNIGAEFNGFASELKFPRGLQRLIFSDFFDDPLDFRLPTHLTELTLGSCFNHPLDEVKFPTTLRRLVFGDEFDQPLCNLPSGLLELELGDGYCRPLVDLPATLQKLTLGYYFDQPLMKLPENLKELYLGFRFNQQITLPRHLIILDLGACFDKHVTGSIPASLRQVRCPCNHVNLCDRLEKLGFEQEPGHHSLFTRFYR